MSKIIKNKKEDVTKKTCFLITPIGSGDSPVRRRVDQWREYIYEPALNDEYEIIRADKIDSPGYITEQIVQYIIDADLVIIDYTGFVPNVMYEAAIRHLTEKPYIQIYEKGTILPFDIHNLRAISYDISDLNYSKKLMEDIKRTLEQIKKPNYKSPQIVKEKFNFNKIVEDPENFVKLLKEYIIIPEGKNFTQQNNDSIVTINEPAYSSLGYSRGFYGGNRIVCPNCGTTKTDTEASWGWGEGMGMSLANKPMTQGTGFYQNKFYKCKVCGTEFQSK